MTCGTVGSSQNTFGIVYDEQIRWVSIAFSGSSAKMACVRDYVRHRLMAGKGQGRRETWIHWWEEYTVHTYLGYRCACFFFFTCVCVCTCLCLQVCAYKLWIYTARIVGKDPDIHVTEAGQKNHLSHWLVSRVQCCAVFGKLENAAAPHGELWRRCCTERLARQSKDTKEATAGVSPLRRGHSPPLACHCFRVPPLPLAGERPSPAASWPRSAANASCVTSLSITTIVIIGRKVSCGYDLREQPDHQETSCCVIS